MKINNYIAYLEYDDKWMINITAELASFVSNKLDFILRIERCMKNNVVPRLRVQVALLALLGV
jgi:hypothetical protein